MSADAPETTPADPTPDRGWVVVAHLIRPQGRRGELLAEVLTDFPETLAGRPGLFLAPEDYAGSEQGLRPCTVTGSWQPHGKNEGRIVLAIEGVASIGEAEAVAGQDVVVRPEDRAALEDGAAYISDLVGCTLWDGERRVGTVRDVQFPTSADGRRRLLEASPLLVVETDGAEELLVPYVRAYLQAVDVAAKAVHMTLPAGMVGGPDEDVNAVDPDAG